MRELKVYTEVVLTDVVSVGYDIDIELILCNVEGTATALVKEDTSSLYYVVENEKDTYELMRLFYKGTEESREQFMQEKSHIAKTAITACLPSNVGAVPSRVHRGSLK